MKKYKVSKETFNYVTAILADKPSHLLHDWRQWLNANNVGSVSYKAVKELTQFDRNPSVIITQLLQREAELELDEKKYRLYHKQNSDSEQFAYHYFTKSGVLQDSDDFDDVSVLAESNVEALAYYEGQWVWEWAHEVE
jgi:hypothetical protein|nr:MAG TPA: hypothetical protein [Caudoviricetes sp.]